MYILLDAIQKLTNLVSIWSFRMCVKGMVRLILESIVLEFLVSPKAGYIFHEVVHK